MPLSVQRENARLKEAAQQLADVKDALSGFALANGYLPCPATPASNGTAASSGGSCTRQHGFVPASTLGLSGTRNDDNLLLDPWASPLRYSVSAADVDGDGNWDFVAPGEMRDVSVAALAPDLAVCRTAAGSSPANCADAASTLTDTAPFVVLSLGKDWATSSGSDQQENVGASLGGGQAAATIPLPATAFLSAAAGHCSRAMNTTTLLPGHRHWACTGTWCPAGNCPDRHFALSL